MKTNRIITENEKDLIIKEYIVNFKSTVEIGKEFGVTANLINRILRKNGVEIRHKGFVNGKKCGSPSPFKEYVTDTELLIKLYNECVPIKGICDKLGVGRRAVYRKIEELGLKRPKSMKSRDQYDDSKDELIIKLYQEGFSPNEISEVVGLSRGAVKLHLKHNNIKLRNISKGLFSHNNKEFPKELEDYETLYDMYVVQKLSKKDIASTFNVGTSVVNRCLRFFGIHIRNCSESKYGLFVGEKHPNWKGGISGLYARLREYFKVNLISKVIKRDGKKCQMCGDTHNLHVHHIKHFKDIFNEILDEHKELDIQKDQDKLYDIMINDERMNDLNNLITYCKECHLFKVHGYKKHK